MTWFRVDDSFPSHPKVLRIVRRERPAVVGLWTLAGAWCGWNLTDGHLDAHMVEELAGTERAASELVRVGLWERTESGYLFHDWSDWNRTRAEVEAEREAARERMRSRRSRRTPPGGSTSSSGDVRANTQEDVEGTSDAVREPRPDPTRPTDTYERGNVTSEDADVRESANDQPPAVPDTATAPLEHDPEADEQAYADFVADARQRTTTPPASPIEGAMPPDRCRNHLELADPPPCGRCKQAREAQEAWIADRDAKVAAARTAAQAEIAAQKAAERAEIDRCDRCDDRGILPSAVVCTHDGRSDPDAIPPGRAAYLAARAAEKARMAGKAKTTPDAPAATGEQLKLIAIRFGERGVNDRDTRLDVIGDVVGRPITTTRELTRAEATVILDRFDHPLPDEPPADDASGPSTDRSRETEGAPNRPGETEATAWAGPTAQPQTPPQVPGAVDDELAYSPQMLEDDADAMEAAVLAARHQADDDGLPDEFDEQYQADQDTWTEPEADYVYAGGGDEPPF